MHECAQSRRLRVFFPQGSEHLPNIRVLHDSLGVTSLLVAAVHRGHEALPALTPGRNEGAAQAATKPAVG